MASKIPKTKLKRGEQRAGRLNPNRRIETQYYKSMTVRIRHLAKVKDSIIRLLTANEDRFQVDAPRNEMQSKIKELRDNYNGIYTVAKNKRLSNRLFSRVSKQNKASLSGALDRFGINVGDLLKRENLSDFAGVSIQNNVNLIKSIGSDHFDKIESIVFNGMSNGSTVEDIAKQLTALNGKNYNRARLIARDQVASINTQLNKKRLTDIGVSKAEWVTSNDERVRGGKPNSKQDHRALEGKIFDISKGIADPKSGKIIWPGSEINCRCDMIPIIE